MQSFPHHYTVTSHSSADSNVTLNAAGLPELVSAPPKEFDGPGDQWSPESLLVAAIADCFILSFKAVAKASKFDWIDLQCEATGVLDRRDKVTCFVRFDVKATLTIGADVKGELATKLLEKAEHVCLITNSLSGESHLTTEIKTQ